MIEHQNPAVRCAICLYQVGLGYDRISRTTGIPRDRVCKWIQTHRKKYNLVSFHPLPSIPRPPRKPRDQTKSRIKSLENYYRLKRENPEYLRLAAKKAYQRQSQNPALLLKKRLRCRLWKFIHKIQKSSRVVEITGCDLSFLKSHFERQFQKGMSWANSNLWEIDHIVPCKSFDLNDPHQVSQCFHFSNLRPLWRSQNRSKRDTIIECQPELILKNSKK